MRASVKLTQFACGCIALGEGTEQICRNHQKRPLSVEYCDVEVVELEGDEQAAKNTQDFVKEISDHVAQLQQNREEKR